MAKILISFILYSILKVTVQYSIIGRILQATDVNETVNATVTQIRAELATVIAKKTNVVNQRTAILSDMNDTQIRLATYQNNLPNAIIEAETAYTAYYNKRLQCDGLNAESVFIGRATKVPVDTCLQFPVPLQASQLYTQKLQLENFQADTALTQKIQNSQSEFVVDAQAELAIYQDLYSFFSQKGNTNLKNKYGTQKDAFNNFYLQEQMILTSRNQTFAAATINQNQLAQTIATVQNQLASQKTACASSLSTLLTTLNQKLSAVISIKFEISKAESHLNTQFQKLEAQQTIIENVSAEEAEVAARYTAAAPAPFNF